MKFVLVHGGLHGAWCWDKLIPELTALGAGAVAMDLPGLGQRLTEESSIEENTRSVIDVIEDGDILVGHSMGGGVISIVADAIPDRLSRLIYIAAVVPIEGRPFIEACPNNPSGALVADEEGFYCATTLEAANDVFYNDCSREDQQWAYSRLARQPLAWASIPLSLPRLWDGKIPRSYVACLNDRSGCLEATAEYIERLGIDTVYPLFASHSPFISKPRELAKLLIKIAKQ